MKLNGKVLVLAIVPWLLSLSCASDPGELNERSEVNSANEQLDKLVGSWEGVCSTWLEPGVLADESAISGRIFGILDGGFLRHEYRGSIHSKPRSGEETIVFNSAKQKFEVSWMDTFHMNYGILFSEGDRTGDGFVVFGHYDIEVGVPRWGWKTEYIVIDENHLRIVSYNVTPDGEAAKAVQVDYTRKPSPGEGP